REIGAHVLGAEHAREEGRELVHPPADRFHLVCERLIPGQLGEPRILVGDHRGAGARQADDRLVVTSSTEQMPLLLLPGLFLASLALRPQLVGVGPLLSTIQHDLRVSHSVAGLLSTGIVLCMGVFAPAAFVLARHAGQRWAIAGALALIAIFGIARAQAGPAAAVI